MNEFEPDKDAIIRLGAWHTCFDCDKVINTDRDVFLKSHPNIFRTRYRCKKCGFNHQRFNKSEFWEMWYIGSSTFSKEAIKLIEKRGLL